jgi:hypothetical protein
VAFGDSATDDGVEAPLLGTGGGGLVDAAGGGTRRPGGGFGRGGLVIVGSSVPGAVAKVMRPHCDRLKVPRRLDPFNGAGSELGRPLRWTGVWPNCPEIIDSGDFCREYVTNGSPHADIIDAA